MPIGLALAITRPATRPWVAATIALAAVALIFVPVLWVAIGVLVVAALVSASRQPRLRDETHDRPPA